MRQIRFAGGKNQRIHGIKEGAAKLIEKMKFISVIGPKDQLDTVTRQYLCRYEIQLENAMGELKHLNNITPNA